MIKLPFSKTQQSSICSRGKKMLSMLVGLTMSILSVSAQDAQIESNITLTSSKDTTTGIQLKLGNENESQPLTLSQPTETVKPAPVTYWHPNPSKAMWYSILCPGLGQIYNRSYWKVPIIYGGTAVFAYLISWQGRMYNDYSTAYYDITDNDPNTRSYERLFKNINTDNEEWKKNTLRKKRDSYRRYRDLCIFGVGILYVLNIVDAFVDGHLYDFSVTNDLSMRVEPVIQYPGLGNGWQTEENMFGLQCSITF